ncbi:Peroxidase [Trema orientale]|uniref:peroxidase n=1 Tax=Trema orientale TaxID=63057 RepID=A0A2P5CLX9_TREOI|nr:Peroxidase [Trema orientale]
MDMSYGSDKLTKIIIYSGGPSWKVSLGRRDSLTASRTLAAEQLAQAIDSLAKLESRFAARNLDTTDLVALSGAHTIGRASCQACGYRVYNFTKHGMHDDTLNPTLSDNILKLCPDGGDDYVWTELDILTPDTFDDKYYINLLSQTELSSPIKSCFQRVELILSPLLSTSQRIKRLSLRALW